MHGAVDVVEARKAAVGDGTEVRRLLPQRVLRTIGAWCFLDHYGPDDVSAGPGMRVPPHPHIGLQTASWLFDGLVLHRDSLGSEQLIRPGELNLMTSGRGIVHAEDSPATGERPPVLHGVQLWIALPADHRFGEPGFAHHADLPVLRSGGATVTVVVGEYGGERSPAEVFSPLMGLEVVVEGGAQVALAVNPGFEHGVISVDGHATVEGADIQPGLLAHLPTGLSSIGLSAAGETARFFVVGGAPFGERLVMWWNFVARTGEEIAQARSAWEAWRLGEVRAGGFRAMGPGLAPGKHCVPPSQQSPGEPLAAPPLPAGPLLPR
jgi:redox-sensitive bicupin YhaK (pirin superfamily)